MSFFTKKYFLFFLIFAALPVAIYFISAVSYLSKCTKPRLSCLDHRKAGCNIDGEYTIGTTKKSTDVTCDMETDSGGWTLVGNYLHRKAAPGAAAVLRNGTYPLEKQNILGHNEVGTPSWGHVSNATLSAFPFREIRFRCQTTAHQRLVDFAVSSENCLNYFRTGQGSCLSSPASKDELVSGTKSLPGNGGQIPKVANIGWKNQGDFAMVNYPFFLDYKNHWAVGRLPGRFECDDYDSGNTASTWHQIWIR